MAYAASMAKEAGPDGGGQEDCVVFRRGSFRVESRGRFDLHDPHQFALFDVRVHLDPAVTLDTRLLSDHAFEILVLSVPLFDRPIVFIRLFLAESRLPRRHNPRDRWAEILREKPSRRVSAA